MNVKDLRPANASSSGDDASSISCGAQLSQRGKERERVCVYVRGRSVARELRYVAPRGVGDARRVAGRVRLEPTRRR